MIKVHIWLGGGLKQIVKADGLWGHASMEVFDGLPSGRVYISWWPMSAVYSILKGDPERSHLVQGIAPGDLGEFAGKPYAVKDLDEDIEFEDGQAPMPPIVLRGLDETRIKAWWRRRLMGQKALYMASRGNCATTVYMGLIAGGSYEFTPWHYLDRPLFSATPPDPESTQYPLVLPHNVMEYARVIELGLKETGWSTQKKFAIVEKIQDPSVRKALKDALDDNGKLNLLEVKLVCKAAMDKGGVTKQEVGDLKRLYRLAKSMNKESKDYLRQFIMKNGK